MLDSVVTADTGNGTQELATALLRAFEVASKGLGDDAFVTAPVFAEQQAELFGLNHTGGTACLAVMHQRFGYIPGHPLLVGETVADGVDQSCDPAESVQTAAGQISDMGYATKRDQMMRADTMDSDATYDNHVAAVVGKPFAQCASWVKIVTAEQTFLPEFAYALGRSSHVCDVRCNTAGTEQIADRPLESRRVKTIPARNADFC